MNSKSMSKNSYVCILYSTIPAALQSLVVQPRTIEVLLMDSLRSFARIVCGLTLSDQKRRLISLCLFGTVATRVIGRLVYPHSGKGKAHAVARRG